MTSDPTALRRPTRRAALASFGRALAVVATAGFTTVGSGCGIRLQDDAPRLPGSGPHPGVQPLRVELQRCRAARAAALQVGAAAVNLAGLHARQIEVVRARLAQLDGTSTTESTTDGSPDAPTGSTARPAKTVQVAAEQAGLDPAGRAALVRVPEPDLGLVAALHVQRAVTVLGLGAALAPWPAATVATPGEATRLLAATRSAEYGLQVATAQATANRAAATRTGLSAIGAQRRALEALAPPGSPSPAGYPLPFPVRTPAAAEKLARQVLESIASATLAGLTAAAGNADALGTLLRWTIEAERSAQAWGAPARPFPGLTLS